MLDKIYKMNVDFHSDCLMKLDPLFLKVDETAAIKGPGECALLFQVFDWGEVKALFLPGELAKKVQGITMPLWVEAEEIFETDLHY